MRGPVPRRLLLLCLLLFACRSGPETSSLAERLTQAEATRDPALFQALAPEQLALAADPEFLARQAILHFHLAGSQAAADLRAACDRRFRAGRTACGLAEPLAQLAEIDPIATPLFELPWLEDAPPPTFLAQAQGQRLPVQLDLAADFNLIHLEGARRLGLPIDDQHPVEFTAPNGQVISALPTLLPPIQLGPITVPPQLALAVAWPEERPLFAKLAARVVFPDRVLAFDFRQGLFRAVAEVPALDEPLYPAPFTFGEAGAQLLVRLHPEDPAIALPLDLEVVESSLAPAQARRLREQGAPAPQDGRLNLSLHVGDAPAETMAVGLDPEGQARAGALGRTWIEGRLLFWDPAARILWFTAKVP